MIAASGSASTGEPEFRLLVLEGSAVRWVLSKDDLPTTVTYAFLTGPAAFKGARNCGTMLPAAAALERSMVDLSGFRREVRVAFDMWEAAANIEFREIENNDKADILIGTQAEPRGRAFTNVAPHGRAGDGMSGISRSLICLNPTARWKIGFDGDLEIYDLRYTMMHEIGHAIGLDHPSAEGQLMSYRYVEHERKLQPGDIAGAAALYGRRDPALAPATGARSSPALLVPPQRDVASPAPSGGARFGLGEAETHFGLGEAETHGGPSAR